MYKRILVPLDGSPISERALPHACVLAKALYAEVFLIRVVVFPDHGFGDIPIEYAASPAVLQEMKHYLEHSASDLRRAGVTVTTFAISGLVADSILDFAEEHRIDLIIMSTYGRSGAVRWLLGSVADRVAHTAQVPVLLIRENKKQHVAAHAVH